MDAERLSRWEEAFRYYSLAYYYELLSSSLMRRWNRWGGGTSFAVALTSSGSAISGWAVWHHNQAGSIVWAILVGAASVLSIAQSRLSVQSHIKTQRRLRKRFATIRSALQIILSDIVSGKDLAAIDKQLGTQRARYFALTASVDPDLAGTRALRERVKADRDVVLNELGFFEKGILKKADGNED